MTDPGDEFFPLIFEAFLKSIEHLGVFGANDLSKSFFEDGSRYKLIFFRSQKVLPVKMSSREKVCFVSLFRDGVTATGFVP